MSTKSPFEIVFSAVISQRLLCSQKGWCEMFVLKLSGIQIILSCDDCIKCYWSRPIKYIYSKVGSAIWRDKWKSLTRLSWLWHSLIEIWEVLENARKIQFKNLVFYICIPESFNTNNSHQLFGYKIIFVNSQHENTNSKGDFLLKNLF